MTIALLHTFVKAQSWGQKSWFTFRCWGQTNVGKSKCWIFSGRWLLCAKVSSRKYHRYMIFKQRLEDEKNLAWFQRIPGFDCEQRCKDTPYLCTANTAPFLVKNFFYLYSRNENVNNHNFNEQETENISLSWNIWSRRFWKKEEKQLRICLPAVLIAEKWKW